MERGTSRRHFLFAGAAAFAVVACRPAVGTTAETSGVAGAGPPATASPAPTLTPVPVQPTASSTPLPPTPSPRPSATPVPRPTETGTATPAPVSQVYAPILCYHNFDDHADLYSCRPDVFQAQLKALKGAGFNAVQVRQVADYLDHGTPLPDNPIAITMDDARATQKIAIGILRDVGFTATLFAPSGWHELGGTYLTELDKNGFEIASHTVWHANLVRTPDKRSEIGQGKKTLEEWLGHAVQGFAFPYGDYRPADLAEVQRVGFTYGCSLFHGVELRTEDRYRWPRLITRTVDEPDALVSRLKGMIADAKAGKEPIVPDTWTS